MSTVVGFTQKKTNDIVDIYNSQKLKAARRLLRCQMLPKTFKHFFSTRLMKYPAKDPLQTKTRERRNKILKSAISLIR